MGQSPPGSSYNSHGDGFPLLNGPTEFGPHHPAISVWTTEPTKICAVGDLLFCVRGSTTGRMNWADQRYCLGRGVAAIRGHSGASDTRYCHYALMDGLPRLLAVATGSTFPSLSREQITRFSVVGHQLSVRQAITHVLGSLDDKIELNRRMNETLEGMARAIFKSWFVDFDPVRAKAEGRQPTGMDAATAALFPDEFEESELGEVPKGWEVSTIGEETEVLGGSTPSTAEPAYWEDGKHYWTTPKDLRLIASPVLLETERRVTEAGLRQISSGLLPVGTVLLSSRAPIGYLAIAQIPVAINQGFIAMVWRWSASQPVCPPLVSAEHRSHYRARQRHDVFGDQ